MSGDRLANLARRAMREETYALIVSPAVADLQRARLTGASSATMWRMWLGVLRAIAGAVMLDGARDIRGGLRSSIDRADRWFAITALGVVCINVISYYPSIRSAPAATQALLMLFLLPSAAAAGILLGLAPVGRALARRPSRNPREIAVAAVLATIAVFVLVDQGVWRANATYRTIAINEFTGGNTTIGEQLQFERQATGGARRRILPFAASAGAFLLLGVALRRQRAVMTPLAAGAGFIIYTLLQSSSLGSPLREWLPAGVLYLIAIGALALASPTSPHWTQAA